MDDTIFSMAEPLQLKVLTNVGVLQPKLKKAAWPCFEVVVAGVEVNKLLNCMLP